MSNTLLESAKQQYYEKNHFKLFIHTSIIALSYFKVKSCKKLMPVTCNFDPSGCHRSYCYNTFIIIK